MNIKYSYNTLTFIIFSLLIVSAFSFFTFADDTKLTLFEDFDRDGLSNAEEKSLGTNPKNADSDNDGYSDGVEIGSGYNPLIPAPGDRIIKKEESVVITPFTSQSTNVTNRISEDVVSYLADAQESGKTEIDSEEFSQAVSDAVDKEVTFESISPIDISTITIKEQDYADLSSKKRDERLKEDAIEYFTAISYVFITAFPQDFFDRSVEDLQFELMTQLTDFSESLTDYSFFEGLADNALIAKSQMAEIEVPEDLLEIHTEGLYLLNYISNIYKSGTYKNVSTDIAPMIATLAQMQGIIDLSMDFQDKINLKMEEYELEELFLDF